MSRAGLTDAQFQAITRALADPRRFSILQRIASQREMACMCLAAELPITQATLSHHIKELAAAGLVACRKEGKCGFFRVHRAVLAQYQRELKRRLTPPPGRRPARAGRPAPAA